MMLFTLPVALLLLVIGGTEIAVGLGLMKGKPWARTLAIVLSVLNLISIPIGTILGGYSLYVLLKSGAKEQYDRLSLGQ